MKREKIHKIINNNHIKIIFASLKSKKKRSKKKKHIQPKYDEGKAVVITPITPNYNTMSNSNYINDLENKVLKNYMDSYNTVKDAYKQEPEKTIDEVYKQEEKEIKKDKSEISPIKRLDDDDELLNIINFVPSNTSGKYSNKYNDSDDDLSNEIARLNLPSNRKKLPLASFDKKLLLSLANPTKSYKNITQAKNEFGVDTSEKAYQILLNMYNEAAATP